MAKFKKGVSGNPATQISGESAEAMQLRSAAARKRNRTLRETLLAALQEDGGEGMTKMEILVRQAMNNHKKGKLTFHDLKDLASVLGEQTINVKTDGPQIVPMPPEAIEALGKWANKTGADTPGEE